MRQNFDASLRAVLVHEGGFSNHPHDNGGATMKGVTQAVYDAWRRRNGLPVRSVASIADAELQAIYRREYWDAVKADLLPSGLDYCVFDFAVNSGPSRAIRFLQSALGVAVDGVIGPVTLRAVEESDVRSVISRICDARMEFLRRHNDWPTFGRGWTNRVNGVRAKALSMAMLPPAPDVEPVPPPEAPPEGQGKPVAAVVLGAVLAAAAALGAWIMGLWGGN